MEYRSRAALLGLPAIHIATGSMVEGRYKRGVATGWIAIGDIAVGVVFSCGGIAVGGIALGGLTLGLFPLGGLAVGLVAFGGFSVGVVAIGGLALGWYAAIGGLAVAHDYAVGGVAVAQNVLHPLQPGIMSLSSIPHPPFRWSDAVVFSLIVVGLVLLVLTIQAKRRE
jgi:hypothetical protein